MFNPTSKSLSLIRCTIILLIALFACYTLQAQEYYIKLKHEPIIIPGQNFYITEVVDGRLNQTDIGFVQTGAFNKKVRADFEHGLATELTDYFRTCQTVFSNFEPILLRVTYLDIYEKTTFNELGRVDIRVEFYRVVDDMVIKIYQADAYEEEYGMDVTKGHEKRIRKVLTRCLNDFAKSGVTREIPLVQTENEEAIPKEPQSGWMAQEELEQTPVVVEETHFSADKKRITAPWADNINFMYSTGFNTTGFQIQYLGWADTIRHGQWFMPFTYSFSFYAIKPGLLNNTDYQSMTSITGGVLLPFCMRLNDHLYLSLQGGLGIGFESLQYPDESNVNHFIFDATANQYLMLLPVKNAGVNLGIGVYEYFVTSRVYSWDVGLKFMFGVKF